MKKHFFFPKKQYMFAEFKTKRTKHIISNDGIFYAHLKAICKEKKAVQIPVAVVEICQFVWSRTGGEQPFLFSKIFINKMTRRNENCNFATQSGAKARLHGTKSVESNAVERSSGKLKNREAAKLFRMAANAIANSPEELTGSLERSRYNCLFHVSAPDGTMFSINIHSREGGVI